MAPPPAGAAAYTDRIKRCSSFGGLLLPLACYHYFAHTTCPCHQNKRSTIWRSQNTISPTCITWDFLISSTIPLPNTFMHFFHSCAWPLRTPFLLSWILWAPGLNHIIMPPFGPTTTSPTHFRYLILYIPSSLHYAKHALVSRNLVSIGFTWLFADTTWWRHTSLSPPMYA